MLDPDPLKMNADPQPCVQALEKLECPLQERLLPRNMQSAEQQQEVEGDGFINIQLELPPEAEEGEPPARNRIGTL